jgi:hypothetical protein
MFGWILCVVLLAFAVRCPLVGAVQRIKEMFITLPTSVRNKVPRHSYVPVMQYNSLNYTAVLYSKHSKTTA